MIDPSFYESLGPLPLADLAARCGAALSDPASHDVAIAHVTSITDGGEGAIAFVRDHKRLSALAESRLSACILTAAEAEASKGFNVHLLIADRPQVAFVDVCNALVRPHAADYGDNGVHPDAEISDSAKIFPGACIGRGAKISSGVVIGPNAVIGVGVEIGDDSHIGPGVVVQFAKLGARVKILANAVVGDSGFGVVAGADGAIDLPHLGRVIIGDDVTIGACTTIDRGMLTDTIIGVATKIDNLVQIAHNVVIGSSCIIAGCSGVSGSVTIEDGAILGGAVGVSDHVRVGAGARLAGATLVMRDVPAGETWAGAPARPVMQFFRETAALARLARRLKPKRGA